MSKPTAAASNVKKRSLSQMGGGGTGAADGSTVCFYDECKRPKKQTIDYVKCQSCWSF